MMDTIRGAIRERRKLEFVYSGHTRIAEPHVAGIKDGREGILAYQTGGTSSSGELPEWRRFHLDGISQLRVLDDTFPGKRESPSGMHSAWDEKYEIVD